MSTGRALVVGLKSVDPNAYGGWDGKNGCWGCELDADNIAAILANLGYEIETLHTAEATEDAILAGLDRAAETAADGDVFVFYYSGHGGQQPDVSGDEMDGKDETLVAYDGQLNDDRLNERWKKFAAGVRLVMISDSCNSGTNYRAAPGEITTRTPATPFGDAAAGDSIDAAMIHMGGCRDSSTSAGYQAGGAFTMALCNAWNSGHYDGDYPSFYQQIRDAVTGQIPQYSEYGPVSDMFRAQRPFTI